MFKGVFIVVATVLATGAGTKVPAEAKPSTEVRGAVMFWLLDRNGDGAVDKSEVEALRATIFDAVDANKDGSVTREEFLGMVETFENRRATRGTAEQRHGRRDTRGNYQSRRGDLGEEQLIPRHGRRAEHEDERGKPRKDDLATQHTPGAQPERTGARAERRSERMMRRLGITETDALEKTDFVATTPSLFERADQDGDGTLSKSEFAPASKHIGRLIIME